MGLHMIDVIGQFDKDRNEKVQMRVGIHTGRVICGIVGERRYKVSHCGSFHTHRSIFDPGKSFRFY